MDGDTREALAETPVMQASDDPRTEASEDGAPLSGAEAADTTEVEDDGPSPEVLAEAAAAERDAAARRARTTEGGETAGGVEDAEDGEDAEVAEIAEVAEGAGSGPDAVEASEPQPETVAADASADDDAAAEGDAAEGDAEDAAAEPEPGPGASLSDEELRREVCALLFASPDALSEARLAQLTQGAPRARIRTALADLEADLAASPLPLEVRKLAGGWRLMTAAEVNEVVGRLFQARKAERLSAAGLETLSVVAYRQPVTKAEIEAIRGVQCGPMLRTLVDRGLVKVTGRADQPGSPLQYGTTKDFLDRFGLGGLDELPRDGELLG